MRVRSLSLGPESWIASIPSRFTSIRRHDGAMRRPSVLAMSGIGASILHKAACILITVATVGGGRGGLDQAFSMTTGGYLTGVVDVSNVAHELILALETVVATIFAPLKLAGELLGRSTVASFGVAPEVIEGLHFGGAVRRVTLVAIVL